MPANHASVCLSLDCYSKMRNPPTKPSGPKGKQKANNEMREMAASIANKEMREMAASIYNIDYRKDFVHPKGKASFIPKPPVAELFSRTRATRPAFYQAPLLLFP